MTPGVNAFLFLLTVVRLDNLVVHVKMLPSLDRMCPIPCPFREILRPIEPATLYQLPIHLGHLSYPGRVPELRVVKRWVYNLSDVLFRAIDAYNLSNHRDEIRKRTTMGMPTERSVAERLYWICSEPSELVEVIRRATVPKESHTPLRCSSLPAPCEVRSVKFWSFVGSSKSRWLMELAGVSIV